MSLQDVKLLLGLQDNSEKDDQLTLIISMVERQLASRFGDAGIPDGLDYVVTEVAITRFNRLGSEGMTQESVEGHSVTYGTNDFAPYESVIQAHLNKETGPVKGRFRFV